MSRQPSTVRELVHWGERRFKRAGIFYGHGTLEAREEAVYIVFGALDLPFDCPEDRLDEPLSGTDVQRIQALLKARIETRKPAAYLLGKAWFAGLEFEVNEHTLVPRSPIAELIEQGFSPWVQEESLRRVLDLCTGSGCIGIACALAFPEARVDITDISPEALAVARRNIDRYQLQDRVRPLCSDLFEALPGERYDLIVSNPPYVPAGEIAELPAEYHYEPVLGLAAGDDGLDIVIRILCAAHRHLTEQGVLVVEVGDREQALAARFPEVPFTWLEFERGSGADGVFLLDAAQVLAHFPP